MPRGKAVEEHGAARPREAAPDPAVDSTERDRAIMDGGPGAGDGERSSFDFEYKGKKFNSAEEVSAYIDDLQKQRQTPPPAPKQEEPKAPAKESKKRAGDDIDWDKELYSNPKKVFSDFRDQLTNEIRQEMANDYRTDQALRSFWTSFYEENKDLRGKELLVNAVFQDALKDIGDLPMAQARDKLSERVHDEIVKLGGSPPRNDGKRSASERTLVESGSGPARRGRTDKSEEPNIPRSLSALIRSRQKARRQQPTERATQQ